MLTVKEVIKNEFKSKHNYALREVFNIFSQIYNISKEEFKFIGYGYDEIIEILEDGKIGEKSNDEFFLRRGDILNLFLYIADKIELNSQKVEKKECIKLIKKNKKSMKMLKDSKKGTRLLIDAKKIEDIILLTFFHRKTNYRNLEDIMEKSKKAVSYLLAAAALTTVTTASVNQNVKAENDVKVTTEPAQETGKVSAVVLENEQGAVIRVTAHEDVQKVKTTYTVDGTQAKTVNFGNLTKGQVKDIQVSFGTQAPTVKTVKTLPNTAVVSDRVEFAKTVKSHAIKGSVSFEYETKKVLAIEPDTPVVPTAPKPTDSVKPVKPVDTTKPVAPTKPVDTVKPTEPTEPTEPTKPVDVTKPAEPVKPVDTTKPTEPAKPVEKPTTPVGTKPKDEPTTPKEDNGTWKEETRTRTVTVDEEYTENTTEDVFETKQLFDDWVEILGDHDELLKSVGWRDDYTDDQITDMLLAFPSSIKNPHTNIVRKVRETKKVKVGTKTVPVTKVRKVQKQETYTVWVNSKTGEVRTERP